MTRPSNHVRARSGRQGPDSKDFQAGTIDCRQSVPTVRGAPLREHSNITVQPSAPEVDLQ